MDIKKLAQNLAKEMLNFRQKRLEEMGYKSIFELKKDKGEKEMKKFLDKTNKDFKEIKEKEKGKKEDKE